MEELHRVRRPAVSGGALLAVAIWVLPAAASAYVGPGAGLSMGGALLAVLAAVAFTLVGLLLWPLRMLWRSLKGGRGTQAGAEEAVADGTHD